MIEVWQALQNADLTEGRGPMVPKASFLRREDAEEAAQRLDGVMGFGCGEVSREPLIVYETLEEWPGHTRPAYRDNLRQRALRKLSPDERQALGFPRD